MTDAQQFGVVLIVWLSVLVLAGVGMLFGRAALWGVKGNKRKDGHE